MILVYMLMIEDNIHCRCNYEVRKLTYGRLKGILARKDLRFRTPEWTWILEAQSKCLELRTSVILISRKIAQLRLWKELVAAGETGSARQQLVGIVL